MGGLAVGSCPVPSGQPHRREPRVADPVVLCGARSLAGRAQTQLKGCVGPVIPFPTTKEEVVKGSCEEDPAAGRNPPACSFSPPPRTDAGAAALPAQVKRAVVQVISAMAHHGYLEQPGGEAMMEFLVRQCALPSDAVSTSRWGKTPKGRYPGGTVHVSGSLQHQFRQTRGGDSPAPRSVDVQRSL